MALWYELVFCVIYTPWILLISVSWAHLGKHFYRTGKFQRADTGLIFRVVWVLTVCSLLFQGLESKAHKVSVVALRLYVHYGRKCCCLCTVVLRQWCVFVSVLFIYLFWDKDLLCSSGCTWKCDVVLCYNAWLLFSFFIRLFIFETGSYAVQIVLNFPSFSLSFSSTGIMGLYNHVWFMFDSL